MLVELNRKAKPRLNGCVGVINIDADTAHKGRTAAQFFKSLMGVRGLDITNLSKARRLTCFFLEHSNQVAAIGVEFAFLLGTENGRDDLTCCVPCCTGRELVPL